MSDKEQPLTAKLRCVTGETADQTPYPIPVTALSAESVVLRPLSRAPEPGDIVELTLEEGPQSIAVVDGEVLEVDGEGQLRIRLVNLEPADRRAVATAALRHGIAPPAATQPGERPPETTRKRAITAVMDEVDQDELARASGEPEQADPDPPEAFPGPTASRRSHDSLQQALMAAAAPAAPASDATPVRPDELEQAVLGDASAVPRVLVDAERIDWSTLDNRAGSLLALVDGKRSYGEIVTTAQLSRIAALRLLQELTDRGIIGEG